MASIDSRGIARRAARVATLYVLLGAAWVALSDRILASFVADHARVLRVQTAKGWLFVLLSGLLVYVLLHAELARRTRAEVALEASHRRYQAFVEGSIQGLALERDFVVLFANTAFARIFGFPSAEAITGTDMRTLIDPEEVPRCEGYYRARVAGEPAPTRYEFRARRRDGTPIWVSNVVTVMTWEGQTGVFVTLVDVTEIKQAEEALRHERAARAIAERLAVLGRMAAGVAHELRNPLTVVIGRTRMLADAAAAGPTVPREVVEQQIPGLQEAADRMRRIVDSLSNYSKPAGAPAPVDIREVLINVRDLLAIEGRRSGIAVVADLEDGLPRVVGHRSHLVQVLVNLATNAVEAMTETAGGQVTLRARAHGDLVLVEVLDTGPGIPDDVLGRIWEPFYTTKAEGTGLGLSIVKSLVAEQPGAAITVESPPGQGATFRLTLSAERTPELPNAHAQGLPG